MSEEAFCPIHKLDITEIKVFGSMALRCPKCPDPMRWGWTGRPFMQCLVKECHSYLELDEQTFWEGEQGEVRCSKCGNGYRYKLKDEVLIVYRAQLPPPESPLKKQAREARDQVLQGVGKGAVEVFFDFLSGGTKKR